MQQNCLHSVGAAPVLLCLGLLKRIYKSIRPEVRERIQAAKGKRLSKDDEYLFMGPDMRQLVVKERETEALFCCKDLGLRINQPVVNIQLIYGAMHNYKRAVAEYNDPLLKYAGEQNFDAGLSQRYLTVDAMGEFELLLEDSDLKPHVLSGQLVLDPTQPWVLKALNHYNFRQALEGKLITLSQVQELTEDQVYHLKNAYKGKDLQEKVLQCIEENKRVNPEPSKLKK